jgi:CHAT domain-containing protein
MQAKPVFAGYRQVPWLARSHNVTVVPSAAAFITLRSLPPGSPKRENLVGFGDPYFSRDQAALAEADGVQIAEASEAETEDEVDVVRGQPLKLRAAPQTEKVDKAELAMLPRLPDTREELKAIARALNVDPARSLFLGKESSEKTVESLDLTRFRVIAFATHGLIADWVVLSACNTGAGAGAGAEAASGLGSAFFYAGTRALLVTNWSVHSASARELTSDLFDAKAPVPAYRAAKLCVSR